LLHSATPDLNGIGYEEFAYLVDLFFGPRTPQRLLLYASVDEDSRSLPEIARKSAAGYCSAERFLSVDGLSKSACIVTDVEMPAMSGLGLLHHIRSVNSPVPAVIITGKPQRAPRLSTWNGMRLASSANQ
jgi:hypothetical protein